MERYALGHFSVARIGFGAMQLPGPGVFGPPRDRSAALTVLRRAVELGVDHIDTAQYYGPDVANELIHAALSPYPAGLALVSKVGGRRDSSGGWLPYNEPAELRRGIEDNLRSLEVDQLAVVNLRLMDEGEPGQQFDDQLAAMIQARDDGLIGGIGLSNVTLQHLNRALESTAIACVQNPLNLASRESLPLLTECNARGIAFVPGAGQRAADRRRAAAGPHPGSDRAGLGPEPGAERAADSGHVLRDAPDGEPGGRRHRARRGRPAGTGGGRLTEALSAPGDNGREFPASHRKTTALAAGASFLSGNEP
jgi:pyridoxine 4-dehydrogenase